MSESDVKPVKTEDSMNIVVRDQTGGEVHFKIKQNTKFRKVFDAYCQKKSLDPAGVKFIFEGTRLSADSTPADHGMEDQDAVDAMLQQTGGH